MDVQAIVDAVRALGFAVVDPMPLHEFRELRDYLYSRQVLPDSHVPITAKQRNRQLCPREQAKDWDCICLTLSDAILAPHVMELGFQYLDVAGVYLGRSPPLAYSTNAFWTRPSMGQTRGDIQEFHDDHDDTAFLAMFVYITDVVAEEDGPHDLIGPDGVMRTVYGPAGTVFLADTRHQHRGRRPRAGERGMMWYRWGVSEQPWSYGWDENKPIEAVLLGDRYPTDPRLRESIRLLVA